MNAPRRCGMGAGLRAMGRPATVGFVVKQFHGGVWRYFAGRNDALGAIRWDSTIEGATLFPRRRDAHAVALKLGGDTLSVGGYVVARRIK